MDALRRWTLAVGAARDRVAGRDASLAVERHRPLLPGAELADLAAEPDAHRVAEALGLHGDGELPGAHRDPQRRALEDQREREAVEAQGEPRVEGQHAVAGAGAEVGPLEEVEGPRHHPHVDALLGGAALHVADVGLDGDEEALPGALGVDAGEHRGVRDERERRAVRGAPVVVGDGAPREVLVVGDRVVAEAGEDLAQLVVAEQEEQHDRVGLLGELVVVGVVTLGLEDAVHPLDVLVLGPVAVPVELGEVRVALELGDHRVAVVVAVGRHRHRRAHLRPARDLVVGDPEPAAQGAAAALGQQGEHLRGGRADPGDHHVGVGVVAQPAGLGAAGSARGTRRAPSRRGSRSARCSGSCARSSPRTARSRASARRRSRAGTPGRRWPGSTARRCRRSRR